jgi:hypothetical protein
MRYRTDVAHSTLAAFTATLLLTGCAASTLDRRDEAPASLTLLDAYFTNVIVPTGLTYENPAQVGPRTRRFDPARDKHVVFVAVYNPRYGGTFRGRLLRPNGDEHGTFTVEIPGRSTGGQWQANRRWWTTTSLAPYPGVWEMQLWVNEEPMARFHFALESSSRPPQR